MFSNKTYDILKYIAFVFYPALVALVGSILKALNVPNTETILIIMASFETFFGAILGVSNLNYKKELKNKEKEMEE